MTNAYTPLHAETEELLLPYTDHLTNAEFDALVSEIVENHKRALAGDFGFIERR